MKSQEQGKIAGKRMDGVVLGILLSVAVGCWMSWMNQPDDYEPELNNVDVTKSYMNMYKGTDPSLDYVDPRTIKKTETKDKIIITIPNRFDKPNDALDRYIENYLEENPEVIQEYLDGTR